MLFIVLCVFEIIILTVGFPGLPEGGPCHQHTRRTACSRRHPHQKEPPHNPTIRAHFLGVKISIKMQMPRKEN